MRSRTRKVLIVTALILVAGAAGLYISNPLRRAQEGTSSPVTVRLKWLHQAQFAGFYVAKEVGFYREEGLDVALNAGGVDFPAIQMVAGGAEDFGVAGADQILLARDKGVPVVALAVIYRKSPMVFFSLKDSHITTPRDFVGKRVGVKPGGNEELTYRALVRKAGVDEKRITEIPVKYDMTPLLTGDVDVWPGYAINEPIVAQEKGFEVNLIWPSDYGVNLYADTLFATERTISERPELVEKFVRATLKGWKYAIEHPDEAVSFTLEHGAQLDRQHEMRMLQASASLVKPDQEPFGWMDKSRWEEMATLLFDQGFVKQQINVSDVFTTRFLTPQEATVTNQ